MFISNEEKLRISGLLELGSTQISALRTVVSALEKRITELEKAKPVKAKKTKKVMTPEQKAKQREYQRLYKARKKEEANNLATAVELLKENNVSS
jgi:hypothetical protein